jgi:hypothetical protein
LFGTFTAWVASWFVEDKEDQREQRQKKEEKVERDESPNG